MTATATHFWDRIARRYAAQAIRDPESYAYTLERTRSYLAPNQTGLELGCGTGSTALALAPSLGQITATDISPEMIAIAREKAAAEGIGNARFEVADVAGSAQGETFDAVMAHNLLHLLPDLNDDLDRIAALVKPGGLFISKTPVRPDGRSLKFAAIRVMIALMRAVGKAPGVQFETAQGLETALESRGFRVIETWARPGLLSTRYVVARKTV